MAANTKAIRADVNRMIAERLDVDQIAERLGTTRRKLGRFLDRMRNCGELVAEPVIVKRVTKTDRVLKLVNKGKTVREICNELNCCEGTVSRLISTLRQQGKIVGVVRYNRPAAKASKGLRRHDLVARAMIAAKTATGGREVPSDMLAQIAAFRGKVTKCPTRWADGSEAFRASMIIPETV